MKLILGSVFGILGLSSIVFGCPLLMVAGGLYYFFDQRFENSVLVPGTVVSMYQTESYDSDSGNYHTVYCPTVEYTIESGETYTVDLNECSTPPAYKKGDPVEVYYDPAQPDNAQLKGGVMQLVGNIFVVVLGIFGVVLSFAGAVMIVVSAVVVLRKEESTTGF